MLQKPDFSINRNPIGTSDGAAKREYNIHAENKKARLCCTVIFHVFIILHSSIVTGLASPIHMGTMAYVVVKYT